MSITNNNVIQCDIDLIISSRNDWQNLAGKSVLVTGANGFIPSYIVYTLLALNDTVLMDNKIQIFALVRNHDKAKKKFGLLIGRQDFTLIVQDITNFSIFDKPLDIIIHAASQASPKYYGTDPVGTIKANTIGTANLLDLAVKKNIERFIFISSGEVYGVLDGTIPIISEDYTGNVDITNIRSCYAESKRVGETMCVSWAHQYGFHVNMLRLSHTYGPGVELDDGRVFGDFVRNIINNENIKLNSDGSAKRCFLYITDMIQALFTILFKGDNLEAYNVSASTGISIFDLAKLLCSLNPEKQLAIEFTNPIIDSRYLKSSSTEILLSTQKLSSLGWSETVTLTDGFTRMIKSYN